MGRTIQIDTIYSIFISLHNTFNSITLWIKDITIESKAVISFLIVGWDGCSKSKSRYLFIVVVVLQDVANAFYCIKVLVLLEIEVMKWLRTARNTIWKCEVDRNWKADFASTENIIQECKSFLQFKLREFQQVSWICLSFAIYNQKFFLARLDLG